MAGSNRNQSLVFCGPEFAEEFLEGVEAYYPDTTLEQVLDIMQAGPRLWGDASGGSLAWCMPEEYEGSQVYVPSNDSDSLSLLFHEQFGFHVRYTQAETDFIAYLSNTTSQCVEVDIGGEPAFFPAATFMALEVASEVVRVFVIAGTRSSNVEWVNANKFNYHSPDAWETLLRKA